MPTSREHVTSRRVVGNILVLETTMCMHVGQVPTWYMSSRLRLTKLASLGKEVAVYVATQTPEQRLSGIGVAHTSCLHGHRGSTLHSRPLWTRGIQGERRAGSTSINKLGLARGDRDWDHTSPVKLAYLNHYYLSLLNKEGVKLGLGRGSFQLFKT